MATIYRNGLLSPLTDLRTDLNHFLKNVFEDVSAVATNNQFVPRTDVVEKDTQFELHIEVPGMDASDIHVEIKDGALVVFGEKKIERKESNDKYVMVQRESGHFARSFSFPSDVNLEKIDAHYENGVLNVVVPKAEKSMPRRVEVRGK